MIQSADDERRHWETVDRENPVDLHGDPPYSAERVVARLIQAHPKPMRVLDMGCGIGRLTNKVASMVAGHGGVVYGFDISSANVHRAVESAPHNTLYWRNDGRSVPAAIKPKFDLIYSITMFQHIPHDAKWEYVDQASRRLNPGGVLVFTVAVGDEPPTFLNHQLTREELHDMTSAMIGPFAEVSVEPDEITGWTWVVAKW